jgi:hypothetical protein
MHEDAAVVPHPVARFYVFAAVSAATVIPRLETHDATASSVQRGQSLAG